MGSYFSSSTAANYNSACRINAPLTTKVVTPDGSLREFADATKVHEVLGRDHSSCFLCSSDELHYDERIFALAAQVTLQPGQIYFLLPASMLGYRLTGADMAELAVKAASALPIVTAPSKQISDNKGQARIRPMNIQVMPVAETEVTSEGLNANLNTIRSFHDASRVYDDDNNKKKKNRNNSRTNPRSTATFGRKLVLLPSNGQKLGTIEEAAE